MTGGTRSMAAGERPFAAGVVVIGRNEGERLVACLAALQQQPRPVVYVDSGSGDGSVAAARERCARVVELDPSRPFTAARARNEGAQALRALAPDLQFVQFVDGDCELLPGWLDAAEAALHADPACAIVMGHLHERRPTASVYHRLCALEWSAASGKVEDMNGVIGIMMTRLDVFGTLGGFRADLIAGEDPEYAVRVRLAGHVVRKLDAPMATHDADIHRFGQWWRRAVRAGHALGQRAWLHANGPLRDCARERRSTWLWGILLPLLAVALAWPTRGLSLFLIGGHAVLGWRILRHRRRRGDSPGDAWLYMRYTLLAKLANGWGLLQFHWNQLRGRYRLIEYK